MRERQWKQEGICEDVNKHATEIVALLSLAEFNVKINEN